jgi:hypothetical protein
LAFLEQSLVFDVPRPYEEVCEQLAKAIAGGAAGSVRFAFDQFYGKLEGDTFDLELTDGAWVRGPMPTVAGRLIPLSNGVTRVQAKLLLDEAAGWWSATFGAVVLAGTIWLAVGISGPWLLRVGIVLFGLGATLAPWAVFGWQWRRTKRLLRQVVGSETALTMKRHKGAPSAAV